jgi:hypothetical protein
MKHRRIEHFFFRAGNLERAIVFARVVPAIDGFSLCAHKNWSVKQFYRDGKAASSRRNPKPRKLSGQKFAPICVYPPLALL